MHSSSASRTPQNVEIVPRNQHFNVEDVLQTNWHSDDPFKTAFFDAMSILFPLGEQFFIDSVKAYRGEFDDPELERRVRGFMAQEAIHRREHQSYNEALCRARGVSLRKMERVVYRRQRFARKFLSPLQQLAGRLPLSISQPFSPMLCSATRKHLKVRILKWRQCGAGMRWRKRSTRPSPLMCTWR